METINQKLNTLFKKWKKERHYSDDVFVSDGLVYKETTRKIKWKEEIAGAEEDIAVEKLWHDSPLRVAFLLKDTNDSGKDDVRKWMVLDTPESEQSRNLAGGRVGKTGFLPNIARILYGLRYIKQLKGKYTDFEDFKSKYKSQIVEAWRKTIPFAFVETKKVAGKKKVDVKVIKDFLDSDGYLLKQELDYLQPNVIVCTCDDAQFEFITRDYLADERIEDCDKVEYAYDDAPFVDCCLWYYRARNLAVVKSYHPTNRGKIQWTIFERVISPFRKLLDKHPEFFENF